MIPAINYKILSHALRATLSMPAIRNERGDVELRVGRPMRILGGIALVVFGCVAIGVPFAAWLLDDAGWWRTCFWATPVCASLAIGAACELRVRLVCTAIGIGGRTAFRGYRQLRWRDVAEVAWPKASDSFRLVDHNGEVLQVAYWLQGFPEFLRLLRTQVPRRVHEPALKACHARMQLLGVVLPEEEADEDPMQATPHR